MKEFQTNAGLKEPQLTIVREHKEEIKPAKMVSLKRIEYKSQLLLPPPQE